MRSMVELALSVRSSSSGGTASHWATVARFCVESAKYFPISSNKGVKTTNTTEKRNETEFKQYFRPNSLILQYSF